jgi:hypothetical protein
MIEIDSANPSKYIKAYILGDIKSPKGSGWVSSYRAILRDARQATGRNPDTGAKIPGEKHNNWLGALGYMVLLDQIGTCFGPNKKQSNENSFKKALRTFTNFDKDTINALYGLRCAFAHDFSIVHIAENPENPHFNFVLLEGAGPLITHARQRWDGNLDTRTQENFTWINLEVFGDEVEKIAAKLEELTRADQLTIILDGGIIELLNKYTFGIFRH